MDVECAMLATSLGSGWLSRERGGPEPAQMLECALVGATRTSRVLLELDLARGASGGGGGMTQRPGLPPFSAARHTIAIASTLAAPSVEA